MFTPFRICKGRWLYGGFIPGWDLCRRDRVEISTPGVTDSEKKCLPYHCNKFLKGSELPGLGLYLARVVWDIVLGETFLLVGPK